MWMRALVIGMLIASVVPSLARQDQPLAGTAWQLVRFEGGDGKVVTPAQRDRYTLDFAANGSLAARIDCNRGRGVWKSSSAPQLALSVPVMTRAFCGAGSMHDQLVKHLPLIRSFVIRDGHLFLSLQADGGIYEFEPITSLAPLAPIGRASFKCANGPAINATFYKTEPGLAVLVRGAETRVAFAVPAASGARYVGDGVSFWEARGEATVNWSGNEQRCPRQP